MIVGIMEVDLYIYQSNSLKEKRQLIKSLLTRLKNKFNISAAEVGDLDMWNKSGLGLALVSNNREFIDKNFTRIIAYIDQEARLEIVEYRIEIL